jgi:hypothetical protein
VGAPGSERIDAGIEVGGCLHVLVTEQLSDGLERARVRVQDDLGREVPELMRRKLQSQVLEDGFFDQVGDCLLHPWLAGGCHKQGVRALADDRRGDLRSVGPEAI